MPTAIAIAIAVGTSACHRLVPVVETGGVSALAPGTSVRLDLTESGVVTLAPLLGAGVVALDGRLRTRGTDSTRLDVTGTVLRSGLVQLWTGESLVIPNATVARTRVRRADVRRSVLLGVALAGAATMAARIAGVDFTLRGTDRGGTSQPR